MLKTKYIKFITTLFVWISFLVAIITAYADDNIKVYYNNQAYEAKLIIENEYIVKKTVKITSGTVINYSDFNINNTASTQVAIFSAKPTDDYMGTYNRTGYIIKLYTSSWGDSQLTTTWYCNQDWQIWVEDKNGNLFFYKKLVLKVTIGSNTNTKYFYFTFVCDKNKNVIKKPVEVLPFTEKDTEISDIDLLNRALSNSSYSWKIEETKAVETFYSPKPAFQPTFTDILYLQLKIIEKLNESLENLGVDIETIWNTNGDFSYYINWINKFTVYSNKKDFVDAFSGAITFKDVWTATEIIKGQLTRLNCEISWSSDCSNKTISISNKWKYEFYTIKQLKDLIANNQDNITDNINNLYNQINTILSDSNIANLNNSFLSWALHKFKNEILTWKSWLENIVDWAIVNRMFKIWYWAKDRIDNINIIKNIFSSESKEPNLLWIYNYFYELTQLLKSIKKIVQISTIIKSPEKSNILAYITKDDILEEQDILWDVSTKQLDLNYVLPLHIKTYFHIPNNNWAINFVCGSSVEEVRIDSIINNFLNNQNVKTYYDYYNMFYWAVDKWFAWITLSGSKYTLIFNMSKLQWTKYAKYFNFDSNVCNPEAQTNTDWELILEYSTSSNIWSNPTIISDVSSYHNNWYGQTYYLPNISLPEIINSWLKFNWTNGITVENSAEISQNNITSRTIKIKFKTENSGTQILYEQWYENWINMFLSWWKIYGWWWSLRKNCNNWDEFTLPWWWELKVCWNYNYTFTWEILKNSCNIEKNNFYIATLKLTHWQPMSLTVNWNECSNSTITWNVVFDYIVWDNNYVLFPNSPAPARVWFGWYTVRKIDRNWPQIKTFYNSYWETEDTDYIFTQLHSFVGTMEYIRIYK